MEGLHTKRLLFRLWQESDFEAFAHYFSKAENTYFLGGKKNQEEAWRLMASYIGHYHLKGYSYMALEERHTGRLVGTVGLWNSASWPELELGYWILKEMQGKGYATEAAKRVKEYAFNTMRVRTLVSYIDAKNEASQRLALRLGGFYEKDIMLLDFGRHRVYRYSK